MVGRIICREAQSELVTPLKKRYLRSIHEIPMRCCKLFQTLSASSIGPSKQFSIAATELGGYESVISAICVETTMQLCPNEMLIYVRKGLRLARRSNLDSSI